VIFLILALPEGSFTKEGFRKTLYIIKFEIISFIQYLFQRLYIGVNYIRLFFDTNPIYEPYSKLIQKASGHDGRRIRVEYYDDINKKTKLVEYWTTFSSSLEKKNFLSPLGAKFFSKHNNEKKMILQWKFRYALLKEILKKI
jgi:hypothetical protein